MWINLHWLRPGLKSPRVWAVQQAKSVPFCPQIGTFEKGGTVRNKIGTAHDRCCDWAKHCMCSRFRQAKTSHHANFWTCVYSIDAVSWHRYLAFGTKYRCMGTHSGILTASARGFADSENFVWPKQLKIWGTQAILDRSHAWSQINTIPTRIKSFVARRIRNFFKYNPKFSRVTNCSINFQKSLIYLTGASKI